MAILCWKCQVKHLSLLPVLYRHLSDTLSSRRKKQVGWDSADTGAGTWQVQVLTILPASFVTMADSPKNWFSPLLLHLPTAQGHVLVMSLSCREMTRQSTWKAESLTSAKVTSIKTRGNSCAGFHSRPTLEITSVTCNVSAEPIRKLQYCLLPHEIGIIL